MSNTVSHNRSLKTLVAVLGVLLAIAASAGASPASATIAGTGKWIQRTCKYNGEFLGTEGWEGIDNNGDTDVPREFCEGGGGFAVFAAPVSGDDPYAGEVWTYKPPHGSTIAGGTVTASLTARNGLAAVEAQVNFKAVPLLVCEYKSCEHKEAKVTLPSGASQVSLLALCLPVEETGRCHSPGTSLETFNPFSAEGEITAPEITLSASAVPKGSGFTGTLLRESVSGTGTLDFTATDGGPGVYQVRVNIDGHQVLAETPNTNNGKCAAAGTSGGIRVFDYAQPCPTETAVRSEVPTASVADGSHTLEVEVEDAAGNVSSVYTGTVTTLNHAIATTTAIDTASAPPERGPCDGTPCEETGKLTATSGEPKTVAPAFKHSALTLTGRLTGPTGAPIKGAQVKLLQQISGTAASSQIASATTTANGSWSIKAPAGPSRLLEVAYFSHQLDTVPAATLTFHEQIKAVVSLNAPRHVRNQQAFYFKGSLAGGYIPAGGESVQMELKWDGRWRTIEVLPTNTRGKWSYKYVFTAEPGTYRFRALALTNGAYPFLPTKSREVAIKVRR